MKYLIYVYSQRRSSRRSRIHHHLPEGSSYNDEPPNYDDILTGKIPSSIATPIGKLIALKKLKSREDFEKIFVS